MEYHWKPTKPKPDPATLIALLRRENESLRAQVQFWKARSCDCHGCQS